MTRNMNATATTRSSRIAVRTVVLLAAGLAAVAALAVAPAPAHALVLPMTVEQMTDAASSVAVVTPLKATSLVAAGTSLPADRVYTRVPLRVERAIKGTAPSVLRVRGGTAAALTVVVEDSPRFVPGRPTLVFLDGLGRVVGGFQGAIALDGSTAKAVTSAAARRAAARATRSAAMATGPTSPRAVAEPAAVTPTVTGITPMSASAGTGTSVVISGSNFGTSQGTVWFYYQGSTPIGGAVTSWSDSSITVVVPVGTVDGYPASAGSGPVYVRLADGVTTSASFSGFAVPFGYMGYKWASLHRTFRVNPNTPDIAASTVTSLVQAGGQEWDGKSKFSFDFGGACSTTAATYDSNSDVFWGSLPVGILAQASTWYSGGTTLDADIEFNDYYTWGSGSGGTFDIQSITSHEMGHWVGLRDLYGPADATKLMYGYGSAGEVKRTATAGDAAGAAWIYGAPDPTQVAEPTFSPEGGGYPSAADVTIACSTTGATIRYTTDGTDPTAGSALYGGAVHIASATTLKARAFKSGLADSPVHTGTYTIYTPQVAEPTFSPEGGSYVGALSVAITCATPGSTIRYTKDGTDPTAWSALYTGALPVDAATTLKARAFRSGYTDSPVHTAAYTITPPQVAEPTFSPEGGSFVGSVDVTITCATPGATIRYTTDGSDPTASSALYGGAVQVASTTALKARAFLAGFTDSAVHAAAYTITPPQVAEPTFAPDGGSFVGSVDVTITCATTGATIRYTTDGSDPTASSALYSAPVTLTTTTTVRARAFRTGYTDSPVHTATFGVAPPPQVAEPAFAPDGGSFVGTATVSVTCATPGATLRYTTDGTDPTASAAVYGAPLSLSTTTTVKARAFRTGYTDSPVHTATFGVAPPPRVHDRIAGDDRYLTAIQVSLDQYPIGAPAVVLATGANFPDALASPTLARLAGGPVLLVKSGVSAALGDELRRLAPDTVYICGGTGAVPASVDSWVRASLGVTPVRLAGPDRYATAAKVAERVVALTKARNGGVGPSAFALVNGKNFTDAVSAAPVAAANGWPLLLAAGSAPRLPAATSASLATHKPGHTWVVRTGQAIPDAVVHPLTGLIDIKGVDTYDTCARAAGDTFGTGTSWSTVVITTGTNFPDALSAAPYAAGRGAKMLLTYPTSLPTATRSALTGNADAIEATVIVGGPGAVAESVATTIHGILP